jgi:mRNA-degrading endonuclease toxin of MazEF toxin-antitoxin module
MPIPCRGRIVWVELNDPQGKNPKCRPAVILTATDQIKPDSDVWVVGVSTQGASTSAEVSVELPWDRTGHPHPKTGLKERCVVVCTWVAKVPLASIKDYAGIVPGKYFLEILRKVGDLP